MANTIITTVTGGFNGGATIEVDVDSVTVFTATGDSPYNLAYTPSSGTFTLNGESEAITITPPPTSQSNLTITFSGVYSQTYSVPYVGGNTSYGYNFSQTYTYTQPEPPTPTEGFQIQLLKYTGENNRINKRPYIKERFTMNGFLRAESSIIKPIIVFEKTTPPQNNDYNYMYISAFKRYYFIDNIETLVNGVWRISASVDVLFTYAEDILNNKVIINKTSEYTKGNLYLNDGSYVMDSHKYDEVKQFPTGLSEQGYNILICAGGV